MPHAGVAWTESLYGRAALTSEPARRVPPGRPGGASPRRNRCATPSQPVRAAMATPAQAATATPTRPPPVRQGEREEPGMETHPERRETPQTPEARAARSHGTVEPEHGASAVSPDTGLRIPGTMRRVPATVTAPILAALAF